MYVYYDGNNNTEVIFTGILHWFELVFKRYKGILFLKHVTEDFRV